MLCAAMRHCGRSCAAKSVTRKNQLPPHATSPVTSPTPGTVTLTCAARRKLGHCRLRLSRSPAGALAPRRPACRCGYHPLDGAAVSERGNEPDGAVPAHADIADIIEEDDAELAVRTMRLAQERADDGIRAPRLMTIGAAIVVKVLAKAFDALRQRNLRQDRARHLPPSGLGSPPVWESMTSIISISAGPALC